MGSVLVARDRDFVVGMAHIVEDADVFEIVSLAVILERRGEGIGRQLVEEAVTYCCGSWFAPDHGKQTTSSFT